MYVRWCKILMGMRLQCIEPHILHFTPTTEPRAADTFVKKMYFSESGSSGCEVKVEAGCRV